MSFFLDFLICHFTHKVIDGFPGGDSGTLLFELENFWQNDVNAMLDFRYKTRDFKSEEKRELFLNLFDEKFEQTGSNLPEYCERELPQTPHYKYLDHILRSVKQNDHKM